MAAKILLVEDDALMAKNLKVRLEAMGYTVIGPAETLEEAESLAASGRPDAALLDFDVGGGTSVDLAARLADSGVAVAFCTGHASIAEANSTENCLHHTTTLLTVVMSIEAGIV